METGGVLNVITTRNIKPILASTLKLTTWKTSRQNTNVLCVWNPFHPKIPFSLTSPDTTTPHHNIWILNILREHEGSYQINAPQTGNRSMELQWMWFYLQPSIFCGGSHRSKASDDCWIHLFNLLQTLSHQKLLKYSQVSIS